MHPIGSSGGQSKSRSSEVVVDAADGAVLVELEVAAEVVVDDETPAAEVVVEVEVEPSGGSDAVTVMVTLRDCVVPEDVAAVRVIRCSPAERPSVATVVPVPMEPSRLEVQRSASPVSSPCSGSPAPPAKIMEAS